MISDNRSICIVGLGYIGLPTASLLASKGFSVNGYDINSEVIDKINSGVPHFFEPDLEEILSKSIKNNKFKAYKDIKESDIYIIAVPTPFKDSQTDYPSPDLSFVRNAVISICEHLKEGDIVIIESTCPVGTTDLMKHIIHSERRDLIHNEGEGEKIFLAYCPERVLPGKILYELENNDRVIGGISKESTMKVLNFYRSFVKGECIGTDAKTAEMVKLVENSYRDNQIAYANEISVICDEAKIDTWELIKIANRHPRVNILNPGPGVGGHCIAVDPWFLVDSFPSSAKLIKQARVENNNKIKWSQKKISQSIAEYKKKHLKDPSVCFFGVSFKPNIDDLRESPTINIIKNILLEETKQIKFVEPNLIEGSILFDEVNNVTIEEGLKSDLIFVMVSHDEFFKINFPEDKTLFFVNVKSEKEYI